MQFFLNWGKIAEKVKLKKSTNIYLEINFTRIFLHNLFSCIGHTVKGKGSLAEITKKKIKAQNLFAMVIGFFFS